MTGHEATRLIAMLAAAYPTMKMSEETLHVYAVSICDLDYEASKSAIQGIIKEEKWAPAIAEIRKAVIEETVDLPAPEMAWQMVVRRWGESSYSGGDKSIELPQEVRTALNAAGCDPYRYWTAEDRMWLRRSFLEVYGSAYRRILRGENLGLNHAIVEHARGELGATEAEVVLALEDPTELALQDEIENVVMERGSNEG
jgi:hypothetical protein